MEKKFIDTEEILHNKEKRLAFLLKLNDALHPLDNPVDIEEAVTKITLDFIDADWCHYSTIEEDKLIILRDAVRRDLPSLVGEYQTSSFTLFKAVLKSGHPFVVDDVQTTNLLDEELKQLCIQMQNISFITVPVIKNGKPLGLLTLVQSKPRKWTEFEVQLVIETAERTWAAVEKAKTEEALRKSEEKYRTLFTSMDQGFVFCELVRNKEGKGIDYYMLELNSTYEKQTGLSAEMVLGKTILEVFPTMDKGHIDTFAAVVDNQCPVIFEQYFEVNHRWHVVKVYPGEKDKFTVLFSDITERKQGEEKLKESETRFRTMADASPVLIWTLDANGLSSYYNKTFLDFLGFSKDADISDWTPIVHPDDVEFTSDTINTAIAEHRSYSLELRLLRADEQWRWVLAQGNPRTGGNNEFLGFVGSCIDVTERKQAEEKIEESRNQLQNIFLNAPAAIAVFEGPEHKYILANKAYEKLSNRKVADLLGKSMQDLFPELKGTGTLELFDKVLITGESFSAPQYALMVDLKNEGVQRQCYFKFSVEPLKNDLGEIYAVMAMTYDITEQVESRKKLEENDKALRTLQVDLKKNERQLQNIFHATTVAIGVLEGPEHKYIFVNPVTCQILHRTKEELLGKTVKEVFPEVEAQGIIRLYDEVYNTGKPFAINELSVQMDILNNGCSSQIYFNLSCEPLRDIEDKIYAILVTAVDVTEQVESRKKTEESEKKFEAAMQAVEGIIWTNNPKGKMIGEQPGWANLTGQQFEEYQGLGWVKTVHPDDAQPTINAWNDAINHKKIFEFEHRVLTKDNGLRYFAVKAVPAFDDSGAILQWVGVHTDITEQKAALQKIKESEHKFRLLADAMPQHIWTSDTEGNLNYFNQSVYDFSGLSDHQINSEGWLQIVHPDDREENIKVWAESISTGKDFLFEHRFKRYDGEYRWQLSRAIPQLDVNGNIQMWVGTSTDIQDQKTFTNELEKQVTERTEQIEENNIELEKMNKELQSFAYISSHDLQEPLRKIQIFSAQILTEELNNLSAAGKDKFVRMQNSACRMQMLIQDLLTYSRTSKGERVFEMGNLKEIVEEVKIELQEELLQKNAIIDMEADCDFMIIPFQFRQLINNLIGNSLKFVQKKQDPHITIKCSKEMGVTLKNKKLVANKFYWHIVIADNGIGFEQQYNQRIFEVFQRLHGRHEYPGTGIGLAIVKKIVENHSGIIEAIGKINKGSTFNIYIPDQT